MYHKSYKVHWTVNTTIHTKENWILLEFRYEFLNGVIASINQYNQINKSSITVFMEWNKIVTQKMFPIDRYNDKQS